ncbi:Mtc3 protein [Saccharomycopsis crataegensis]|uniref:Mtc3 protein n=1 Tax=Saccharomycopsis crataegensis TaxID=43959 RepID=A0AAV5QGY6_9ASCO|nr:Mtc3 protein [Saccharomycopsis crataegensis]
MNRSLIRLISFQPSIFSTGTRLNAQRCISTHNFQNIQQTWVNLTEDEQDQILDHLAFKQEENWNDMSNEEKKASYFISYGPWGPRTVGGNNASTVSGRVIGALTGSIISIALGLSIYNYTIDQEKLDEFNKYEQINPEN